MIRKTIKKSFIYNFFQLLDILFTFVSVFYFTLTFKIRLKLFGCKYGKNLKVDGKVIIRMQIKGSIEIGDNVKIVSKRRSNLIIRSQIFIFQSIGNGKITIGNGCGLSASVISSRSSIIIGKNVYVGADTKIFDHDFHSLNYVYRGTDLDSKYTLTQPIIIGDNVFIGAYSIILKGVHIGEKSLINAGSVINIKSIPNSSIVQGNPAIIR